MNQLNITKEEIIEAENKLFSAQLVSNVDVLSSLLHDDLIGMAPTGQMITKEMDLDSHRSGTMIIEEASTEIEDIRITEDTAVSVVSMRAKGSMMGTPVEGHFRYLRFWKRFDDGLKIVGASFMQLP